MTNQQYMRSSIHARGDGLAEGFPHSSNSATQPSSAVAFSGLIVAPYSAISSFSQPHRRESSLLTPISGAESPPPSSSSQFISHYPVTTTSNPQQPTPPLSSKMHWSSGFDMTAPSSHNGSPMTMHPSTTQSPFGMSYMVADPSDSAHHGHHHEDEIPEPPAAPYFGHYGVSGTSTAETETSAGPSSHNLHPHLYFANSMSSLGGPVNATLAPGGLLESQAEGLHLDMQQHQHIHHHMPRHHLHPPVLAPSESPLLSQPNSQQIPSIQAGDPGDEDISISSAPAVYPGVDGSNVNSNSRTRRNPSNNPRVHRTPRMRGRQTTSAAAAHGGSRRESIAQEKAEARHATQPEELQEAPSSADQQSEAPAAPLLDPVQFKGDMPETDRFLFELRRRYNDNKGKGMWDPITREYNVHFGTNFDRAALQMRISRAKSKYVMWDEREDQILIEAAKAIERSYYRQVHAKYRELGGNPQADFNVGNVEMRMVELGLADIFMDSWKGDPRISTRRRKKLNERHRASATAASSSRTRQDSNPIAADQNNDQAMTHAYQLQQSFPQQHQHGLAQEMEGTSPMQRADLDPMERERVWEEIETRDYKFEDEVYEPEYMYMALTQAEAEARGKQHRSDGGQAKRSARGAQRARNEMQRDLGRGKTGSRQGKGGKRG